MYCWVEEVEQALEVGATVMKPDAASVWKDSKAKLRWNFMLSSGLGQSMKAGVKLSEFTSSDSDRTGETCRINVIAVHHNEKLLNFPC